MSTPLDLELIKKLLHFKQITNGNLDDITDAGLYFLDGHNIQGTKPIYENWYSLLVIGNFETGDSRRCLQLCNPDQGSLLFTRTKTDTGWTDWRRVATLNDFPDLSNYATKNDLTDAMLPYVTSEYFFDTLKSYIRNADLSAFFTQHANWLHVDTLSHIQQTDFVFEGRFISFDHFSTTNTNPGIAIAIPKQLQVANNMLLLVWKENQLSLWTISGNQMITAGNLLTVQSKQLRLGSNPRIQLNLQTNDEAPKEMHLATIQNAWMYYIPSINLARLYINFDPDHTFDTTTIPAEAQFDVTFNRGCLIHAAGSTGNTTPIFDNFVPNSGNMGQLGIIASQSVAGDWITMIPQIDKLNLIRSISSSSMQLSGYLASPSWL